MGGVPRATLSALGFGGVGGYDGLRVSEHMAITVLNTIVGTQDSPSILVRWTAPSLSLGVPQPTPPSCPLEEQRPSLPPDRRSAAGGGGGERAGLPSPRDPPQQRFF